MPSQEEYLDNLLKDLAENEGKEKGQDDIGEMSAWEPSSVEDALAAAEKAFAEEDLSAPEETFAGEEPPVSKESSLSDKMPVLEDIPVPIFDELEASMDTPVLEEPSEEDAANEMTEEEIIRLLSESSAPEEPSPKQEEPADVLDLLSDTDDADLQAIQELLEKADSNEAIVETAGDETEMPAAEAEKVPDEAVSDKKQKRRERAAAKKAERAGAKEAKAAAKAAKKAKAAQKKAGAGPEAQLEEPFDTSLLDAIVSGADSEAERQDGPAEPAGSKSADGPAEPADSEKAETAGNAEGTGFGGVDDIDLSSLFGDSGGEASLGQDVDEADFLGLGADETDEVLQDIAEREEKQKKGVFSKLVNFLTEEAENEDIPLSEENQEILKDLDKEKGTGKKKKKKSKSKKKEGKDGNGEDDGEQPKKKARSKKEKKPKKEKVSKQEQMPEGEAGIPATPGKKLSFKRVLPILLVALSLGVLLIVFVHSAADYADRKTARTAFYEGDYTTCYQNLFGKDLDESEQVMYAKSESILYIRLWLREYEMFAEEGSEPEALDSLIQTVDKYPVLYAYAAQWNAESEVAAGYTQILEVLADKYGLTEEQAQAIADEPDDQEYTKMVFAIIQGKRFGSWDEPETPAAESSPLEDELPEEAELGKDIFIDSP